jgi:hypothetical protein
MTGSEAEEELGSLYAWLHDDEDIRRHARISLALAEPGPSDMGATFEVIQLVVDSGFQTLSLALAYASWRASRPSRRNRVTIDCDGSKITLDDDELNPVDVIVHTLE